jgi:hypothetical protein
VEARTEAVRWEHSVRGLDVAIGSCFEPAHCGFMSGGESVGLVM